MGWNVHVSVNVLRKSSSRQTDRHTDEWTYGGVVPGESVCVSVAATG